MLSYKFMAALIGAAFASLPAMSQISTASADASMLPFFEKTNRCLMAFDAKARAKKLTPSLYEAALKGACTDEIKDLRGLYSLHNVRSENHDYLVERLDQNVQDAKAMLVSEYVMK